MYLSHLVIAAILLATSHVQGEKKEKNFQVISFEQKTWIEALAYCHLVGMELPSLHSEEENQKLIRAIDASGLTGDRIGVWTSGNDIANEGSFVWISDGLPMTYSDWFPNQPDNDNQNEDCIHLRKYAVGWKWNDFACELKSYFACEF